MKKLFGLWLFSNEEYEKLKEKYNEMVEVVNAMYKDKEKAIDYSRGGEVKEGCGWFFMNYTNYLGKLKRIIEEEK